MSETLRGHALEFGISVAALAAVALHLIFREVAIDNVTMALAFLAALPWLARILRSLSLPGVSVEFRDLKDLKEKVDVFKNDIINRQPPENRPKYNDWYRAWKDRLGANKRFVKCMTSERNAEVHRGARPQAKIEQREFPNVQSEENADKIEEFCDSAVRRRSRGRARRSAAIECFAKSSRKRELCGILAVLPKTPDDCRGREK